MKSNSRGFPCMFSSETWPMRTTLWTFAPIKDFLIVLFFQKKMERRKIQNFGPSWLTSASSSFDKCCKSLWPFTHISFSTPCAQFCLLTVLSLLLHGYPQKRAILEQITKCFKPVCWECPRQKPADLQLLFGIGFWKGRTLRWSTPNEIG